ncbi:MAG TPA: alpha-ketoglutarate-dependent dioxygenase AlkB, partial [Gammaproteobacteria bacterium]
DRRSQQQRKEDTFSIELEHGSLLLMQGPTQHYWQHQIPKTRKPVAARLNITFRQIQTAARNTN